MLNSPEINAAVLGVGTDIAEVERIRGLHTRHGTRFLNRVYTPTERAYCLASANPHPHLAARFAAKEAVAKAFGTGIGEVLGWQCIEVTKALSGKPEIALSASAQAYLKNTLGGTQVLLSLTHTHTLAMAFAVII